MLTRLYIEALLVDPEAADRVWEAWDGGKISDQLVGIVWMLIAGLFCSRDQHGNNREA